MFKLRQTWKDVFSTTKLHSLDMRVQRIDRNWPVANLPQNLTAAKSIIHVNPKFLSRVRNAVNLYFLACLDLHSKFY